jgi:hypothetical protein
VADVRHAGTLPSGYSLVTPPGTFAGGALAVGGSAATDTMTSPGLRVPRPARLTTSALVNLVAGTRYTYLASPCGSGHCQQGSRTVSAHSADPWLR